MTYIPVTIETDPTDLAEDAFAYLEEQVPGWLPSPGNLEAWLIEALAQMAGELRELSVLVPDSIFAYFGESVLGLPPYPATQATGTTSWTAVDAAGYTVDAGTLVGVAPAASYDTYAFEVVDGFTLAPGETIHGGVAIRALEAGAAASGLTGEVEMLDPLAFIASVTLDAPTSGGVDAEDPAAYLDRLSDLATLLTPRPILPQDFAMLAQRQVPGVARATAIDLYDASTQQTGVPRCVTVVCVDANGDPCTAGVKQQVDDLLQAEREVNFLVFVADATYTQIAVTVDVSSYPGYDPADVAARIEADLTSYLSPANWGVPPYGDTSGRSWVNDTTVRYLELAEVVNETEGVHYIRTLSLGIEGQALGQADVVMTGVAPLPQPGTISATAEAEA
jgi:Baseplate J-like protein